MNIIKDLISCVSPTHKLIDDLTECGNSINGILDNLSQIDESEYVISSSEKLNTWNALMKTLDTAIFQFKAAKRGLSIISKLPVGENRKKHASRVMINMNKIRGSISRANKQLAALTNS